jgi:stage III sporulation protein AF
MIENLSSWAKGITLAVIVVSILEMLLPNNKTKKYIKMVMGVFILFNIISPFINAKDLKNLNEIDASKYVNENNKNYVEQKSMDERLEELYIEEIEKDIIKKVEKKGYKVSMCKVDAKITKNEEETGITKIKLKVEKTGEVKQEENSSIENQIVTQVQKIKKVNTKKIEEDKETSLEKSDIQNLKQFLIEEYEVNEKCLEIN